MHEVLERLDALSDVFVDGQRKSELIGRLPDSVAEAMRESGVIRMLQPRDFGGYEASPVDFGEAVMKVASMHGGAGWVAGVVGVHPWEVAQMDRSVQEEVWGDDPDTWVASAYALFGRARKVDGGYVLSGQWPYSTGTDQCDWLFLGGLEVDGAGDVANPTNGLHFLLKRGEYEIVEGSWEVMGLAGSGSKDVIVRETFIPDVRVMRAADLFHGIAARRVGRLSPLYFMGFRWRSPRAPSALPRACSTTSSPTPETE